MRALCGMVVYYTPDGDDGGLLSWVGFMVWGGGLFVVICKEGGSLMVKVG